MRLFSYFIFSAFCILSLTSCSNISCEAKLGLSPSAGCSGSLGRSFENTVSDYTLQATDKNYTGFYYYDHDKYIKKAKKCVSKYFKKKNIRICNDVVNELDKYCFDKNSMYACQYIYEVQRYIIKNPPYENKIYNHTKNNNIFLYTDGRFYIPSSSLYNNNANMDWNTYPFAKLDANHDKIISYSEMKKYMEKIYEIIKIDNNRASLNKSVYEPLAIAGVSHSAIDRTHGIYHLCGKKGHVLTKSDIEACNIAQESKKSIFTIYHDRDKYSLTDILTFSDVNLYRYTPTYEKYLKGLSAANN